MEADNLPPLRTHLSFPVVKQASRWSVHCELDDAVFFPIMFPVWFCPLCLSSVSQDIWVSCDIISACCPSSCMTTPSAPWRPGCRPHALKVSLSDILPADGRSSKRNHNLFSCPLPNLHFIFLLLLNLWGRTRCGWNYQSWKVLKHRLLWHSATFWLWLRWKLELNSWLALSKLRLIVIP